MVVVERWRVSDSSASSSRPAGGAIGGGPQAAGGSVLLNRPTGAATAAREPRADAEPAPEGARAERSAASAARLREVAAEPPEPGARPRLDPQELEALIKERQAAVKRALERAGINPSAARSERLARFHPAVTAPAVDSGEAPRGADAPLPADPAPPVPAPPSPAPPRERTASPEPAASGLEQRAAPDPVAPVAEAGPVAADVASDPFADLDPFLVPAVRAAAAARAAAARIRGVGDRTVRDRALNRRARPEAPVRIAPGLSVEQARTITTVAFRPRRAGSGLLPYAIEYRRSPALPQTGEGEATGPVADASAPPRPDGRFERFRQEVASRNGHTAEDPLDHPWSRTVPVPVNRAEQDRPARWWHLSRLFGRA